jgi:hypothetical protein
MEWPYLRRAILERGGIGPSPDWPRDWYPADLYRNNGNAPDVLAAELRPWCEQWGNGDDAAMFAHLRSAYAAWTAAPAAKRFTLAEMTERHAAREHGKALRAMRATPTPAPVVPRRPGERSFADLVRDLRAKHGADADLSGLRPEYISAYESGERVTVERDERTYRGTVGATRGARPRFVLLLSMDL